MENLEELFKFIEDVVIQAGDLILGYDRLVIDTKSGDTDLVTQVDQETQAFLTSKILEAYPEHSILGEETYQVGTPVPQGPLWVLDPIDGTTNFVKQGDDFVIHVAYFEDEEPLMALIYRVRDKKLYSSVKGQGVKCNGAVIPKPQDISLGESLVSSDIQRMYGNDLMNKVAAEAFGLRHLGASGLDGIKVVEGKYGAFVNSLGGPWDFAPFMVMAPEQGLVLTDFNGEPLTLADYSSFILATPQAHKDLFS